MTATEKSIRELLKSKQSTLWGRSFDISDHEGMGEAVRFISALLRELDERENRIPERERHAVL